MRSKTNTKNLRHVSKTTNEKVAYMSAINGTTKDNDLIVDDLDETSSQKQTLGEREELKKQNNAEHPYVSFATTIEENKGKIIGGFLTLILIPMVGWFTISFLSYRDDVLNLKTKYEFMEKDVTTLQDKYEKIETTTGGNQILLTEIKKDLQYLRGY